ncbi:hypothetical protein [Nonomuraea zeae]|uniref:Uncharacterized protein n=1 Tax=Nonomuraea zeae TaxID=1642303 RepID=A0A5S4GFF4_9ACTN|nr:hypothetical protein [Nonomuraea zeae]TMR31224.1 hypothetical protein ETD85_26565 [Nonomuraea zeae]
MIDYAQFPELTGVYLEDSYVLAITERPGALTFALEAVLTPEHPYHHPPRPGEQYCYARATLLTFTDVTGLEWIRRSPRRYVDAAGQEDLGNIDSLTPERGAYHLDGDWGEVRVFTGRRPRLEYASPR